MPTLIALTDCVTWDYVAPVANVLPMRVRAFGAGFKGLLDRACNKRLPYESKLSTVECRTKKALNLR